MTSLISKLIGRGTQERIFHSRQGNSIHEFRPNTFLTTKKWVTTSGQVGILNRFTGAHSAEIHLVNDKGETVKVVDVDLNSISIARLADIPETRRPDTAKGAQLGYL